MSISIKLAFLATYQLLDEYFNNSQNEKLGMLLSDMNPYLFIDSNSADPAVYYDWKNCAKKVSQKEELTNDEAFKILISFLDFNKEYYNYQVETILDDITLPFYQNRWKYLLKKCESKKRNFFK